MKIKDFLEMRNKLFEYFQSLVPNWPPYVVNEIIYKGFKNNPKQAESWLKTIYSPHFGYKEPNEFRWQLKTIPVNINYFEPNSKKILELGMGGQQMQGAKNDLERHTAQEKLLKNQPSKEPVIFAQTSKGYELIEGRHRTIRSLINWPQGYQQPAWILFANK